MKHAVIYARYSCDSQSEQSIEGQLRVCQEYAKNNGITIVDTYIDRAMTGTNDNRPDFQRMLKDSAKRLWEIVLVYKLDRFSRNKFESAIHKKALKDNGVKVVSAMENIPDTPEGIILESLLEGMNQYYSAELAQKVKRGMRENRRKGIYQGGPVLYGYKIVNHRFVIHEEHAEIVRYIFDRYAKGAYARDIVEDLTAKGIYCGKKPFTLHCIYNLLRNDKYSGTYRHGDEIVDNMYPRLISSELFEKVRAIVDRHHNGRRCLKAEYLLRFKIRCGYCGEMIGAETGTGRHGEVLRYYKCLGRKRYHNGCDKVPVRKEVLEQFILNAVVEHLSSQETLDEIVADVLRLQAEQETFNSTLVMLQNEKTGVDKSLENLMAAIEKGVVTRTTTARLHELEKRQDELERQIRLEKSKIDSKITEKKVRAFYEEALRQEPRMLISSLVKEIVLFDDRMEIHYNTPLRKKAEDRQSISVDSGVDSSQKEIEVKMFVE